MNRPYLPGWFEEENWVMDRSSSILLTTPLPDHVKGATAVT